MAEEAQRQVAAVQAVLAQAQGLNPFKTTIALLKAAIAADKDVARKGDAMLIYMQAAELVATVTASAAPQAQKDGLNKKLAQIDGRIAMGLQDPRKVFEELDEDGSGTLDEGDRAAHVLVHSLEQMCHSYCQPVHVQPCVPFYSRT